MWTKNLCMNINAFECIYSLHSQNRHIAKQIIWRKKLEDHNDKPNKTYLEKQCGQLIRLNVYFLSVHETKRYAIHI